MTAHKKNSRHNVTHKHDTPVIMQMVRTTTQNLIKVASLQQGKSFRDFKEQLILILD